MCYTSISLRHELNITDQRGKLQEPKLVTVRNLGFVGGATAAATIGVPVAGTAGLSAAGFTSAGIAAGSFAASIQGPAVAAGSIFATLQSIGATGGLAILGPVGLIAGAVVGITVGAGFGINYLVKKNKRDKKQKMDSDAHKFIRVIKDNGTQILLVHV